MASPAAAGQIKDSSSGLEFLLHPLVVINTSDHYTRVKANTPQPEGGPAPPPRVLGCLLGAQAGRSVDISNSFELAYSATPEGGVALDEAFLVKRQEQYKQVFPKLDIVGWYASGSALTAADMVLHQKLCVYNESPVYLLLTPEARQGQGLPVQLFESELHHVGGLQQSVFVKAKFSMETSEAERIAVNDVSQVAVSASDKGSGQMVAHYKAQLAAVEALSRNIQDLIALLTAMAEGKTPHNHAVVREAASLLKQLPVVDSAAFRESYQGGYSDSLLTMLLASMTQGAHATHQYIDKVNRAFDRSRRGRGGRSLGPGGSSLFNAYEGPRAMFHGEGMGAGSSVMHYQLG